MNERDDWSHLENEDCYDEFCYLANPANWKNADGSDYVVPESNEKDAGDWSHRANLDSWHEDYVGDFEEANSDEEN